MPRVFSGISANASKEWRCRLTNRSSGPNVASCCLHTQTTRRHVGPLNSTVRRHCNVADEFKIRSTQIPVLRQCSNLEGSILFPRRVQPARQVRVTLRSKLSGEQLPSAEVAGERFQRQWPCTFASPTHASLISLSARACHAIRCTEPSLGRSFSRYCSVAIVHGGCQIVSVQRAA